MPSYTFPPLKIKEVLKCLKELRIPLTSDELKNPTRKKLMEVYEKLLMHMMQISKEEIRQPRFNSMDVFEYPELHDDSIAEFSFHFFLLRLMRAVGLQNCSLRDILFPRFKKCLKMLSALINFAKFREDRLEVYNKCTEETDEIQKLHERVIDENDALKAKLAQLREQREKEAPEIERLQEETGKLAATIGELNKEQADFKTEIRKRKAELRAVSDKIAESKFKLLNLKDENKDLQAQIVKSPERLKKALVDMTSSINIKKDELHKESERLRGLKSRINLLRKVQNKLEKRIDKMKTVGDMMKQSKRLQHEIKDRANNVQDNKENVQATSMTVEHYKKQIEEYQTNLFELQGQFDQKRQEANNLLNVAMQKKMELMRILAEEKAKVEHNKMVFKTRTHQMDLARKAHQQKMVRWTQAYAQLLENVKQYHADLRTRMVEGV